MKLPLKTRGPGVRRGPPKLNHLNIVIIDPAKREVRASKMPMTPDAVLAICGKTMSTCTDLGQEIVGMADRVRVLMIGDRTPRAVAFADPEPTWMLRGENGGPRDICRGIGVVVGYRPDTRKATSLTVSAEWIAERIDWNPGEQEEI